VFYFRNEVGVDRIKAVKEIKKLSLNNLGLIAKRNFAGG
jgi:hypothetical protein